MATVKLDPAKGVQIPNMTTTERNAVSSPETGALVWNTTTSAVNQYNGSAWKEMLRSDGSAASLTAIPAANITGTLPAISGANLTNLPAGGVDGISSSADATAITIDSSERVGIGNTTPNSYEDEAADLVIGNNSSSTGLTIASNNTTGNIYFATGTTGNQKYRASISYSHANERLNVGTNVGSGSFAFDADGLKFHGDTAAANGLYDYEEGTWTPVLGDSAGNNTWSGTATGKYIKVGKAVLCYFHKYTAGTNTSSSYAYVRGLPFISDGYYRFSIHGRGSGTADSSFNWFSELYFPNNTTALQLQDSNRKVGGGAGTQDIELSWIKTDGTVTASFWYQTD